jgi:hypothetical protein
LPFKLHSRPIRHRIGPLLVHAANNARFTAVAEPHGVIHIRPSDVTHWQIGDVRRLKRLVAGTILGGDWDLKVRPRDEILAKNLKFLGLKEHFVDGVPWARTRLFTERYRAEFERRKAIRGCKTLAELAEYYEVYDRLFDDLRRYGFRASCSREEIAPIPIYIGRSGSIVFTDNGNHRLFMAMLLGIETMPVKVAIRHRLWQKTREAFLNETEFAQAPPDLRRHPDMQDLIDRIGRRAGSIEAKAHRKVEHPSPLTLRSYLDR